MWASIHSAGSCAAMPRWPILLEATTNAKMAKQLMQLIQVIVRALSLQMLWRNMTANAVLKYMWSTFKHVCSTVHAPTPRMRAKGTWSL